MLERILEYERDAFFLLNGSDYPFLDRFMWLYSGMKVWLPAAILILCILIYKKDWREIVLLIGAIAVLITLCDQFSSHICKPFFARFRPTHHPAFMEQVKTVLGYRGGNYGFISGHAANAFGVSLFFSLLFRHGLLTGTLFLWAGLTAYSRVYLGVHFISDIVAGAIAGALFGYIIYALYVWARKRMGRVGEGGGAFSPLYPKAEAGDCGRNIAHHAASFVV
ncbi:MAG: lipid A 4'-phosphatase/phosphatase PAP2 family protein [Bacteroidales bacterium]